MTLLLPGFGIRDSGFGFGFGFGFESDDIEQDVCSLLALRARHVQVRYQTNGSRPEGDDEHTAIASARNDSRRVWRLSGDVENDDVGLNGVRVQYDTRAVAQATGDQRRVLVILNEPIHVAIERVNCRRGEDTHLPHCATQHAAMPEGSIDDRARACQHRASWRAEPFRERYRDEVERGGKVGWSLPTRDRRVPQP